MALTHHKVLKDGSFIHEPFTKEAWERAMHDPEVATHWGHRPDDCHDPVARHWAKLRREGYVCGPKQHILADRDDPAWAGSRSVELVKPPKVAPPPPRVILTNPVVWPPEVPLTPQLLSQMSGLCVDDCKSILAGPVKELPSTEREPMADKWGQLLLF